MTSRARFLWVFGAALAMVAAASLTLRLRDVLYPQSDLHAVPAPACELRAGPCTARLPDGAAVTFSVEPRTIPVARPLVLRVTTEGLDVTAVAVDFAGLDMNMGYNRVSLAAVGPSHYQGDAMLPVCVRDHMTWEARVLLTTPGGLLDAPFRFTTARSP